MKDINNYIQESLVSEANDENSFKEYLEKYGCTIIKLEPFDDEEYTSYGVVPIKNTDDEYPCMGIDLNKYWWNDLDPSHTIKNKKIGIWENERKQHEVIIDGFDIYRQGYAYNENNAKLLAEEILKYV